jgi:agmatine deiminase
LRPTLLLPIVLVLSGSGCTVTQRTAPAAVAGEEVTSTSSGAEPLDVAQGPDLGLRLPGDHEPKERVLLAWHSDVWEYEAYFVELVSRLLAEAPLDVLVLPEERQRVSSTLRRAGVDLDRVALIPMELDTFWVRDYGPWITYDGLGRPVIVDGRYDTSRFYDDRVPRLLAARWRVPTVPLPILLEGGHLLVDGDGRCVITDDVVDRNGRRPEDVDVVLRALRSYLGCEVTTIVPSLRGEETGHVDVFAHVPAPGVILVGSYRADQDAENSRRLDRAADLLEAAGWEVRRLPMPPNARREQFRTYTNALAVGGTVFVPVYHGFPNLERRALRVFREAYPGREIERLAADDVIELGGAVHCTALALSPTRIAVDREVVLRQARTRNGPADRPDRGLRARRRARRPPT